MQAAVFVAQGLQGQHVLQRYRRDTRDRAQKIKMVIFEFFFAECDKVQHPNRSLHRHEWHAKHALGFSRVGRGRAENDSPFPERALHQLATDVQLRSGVGFPVPDTARGWLGVNVGGNDNCAAVSRDHFAHELQQLRLQRLDFANGVDRVRDLEQGIQIARHPSDVGAQLLRRRESLGGCAVAKVQRCILPELHHPHSRLLVFRDEENQLTLAHADGIPVSQQLSPYRDSVYKRAVVTVEIHQVKAGIRCGDDEVLPRHGEVGYAEATRGLTADRKLVAVQPHHSAFQWPGHHHDPGVHNNLRPASVADSAKFGSEEFVTRHSTNETDRRANHSDSFSPSTPAGELWHQDWEFDYVTANAGNGKLGPPRNRIGMRLAISQRVAANFQKSSAAKSKLGSETGAPIGGVMKRSIYGALMLLAAALLISVPMVQAQSQLKADVPFTFSVDKQSMSAGNYEIDY